ncbi:hypothetical protein WA158_005084 [Blastocystis sp. Blastoise]
MKAILFFVFLCFSLAHKENKKCGTYDMGCENSLSLTGILSSNEKGDLTRLNATVGFYGSESCLPAEKAFNVRINVPFSRCSFNTTSQADSCNLSSGVSAYFDMIDEATCKSQLGMECVPPVHNGETIDALHDNYTCKIGGLLDVMEVIKLNLGPGDTVKYLQFKFNETHASILLSDSDLAIPRTGDTGCFEHPRKHDGLLLLIFSIYIPIWVIIIIAIVSIALVILVIAIFIHLIKDHKKNSKASEDQKDALVNV